MTTFVSIHTPFMMKSSWLTGSTQRHRIEWPPILNIFSNPRINLLFDLLAAPKKQLHNFKKKTQRHSPSSWLAHHCPLCVGHQHHLARNFTGLGDLPGFPWVPLVPYKAMLQTWAAKPEPLCDVSPSQGWFKVRSARFLWAFVLQNLITNGWFIVISVI